MQFPHSSHDSDRPRREPRRLADIVPQLLARRGYSHLLAHDQLLEAWQQAAGRLHQQSRPGAIRNGVLEIVAKNSAVIQELTFQKRQLLQSLGKQAENLKIKDLRFTVGSID
jgi:predicted nucleic acid-binding Zn ribbon protein